MKIKERFNKDLAGYALLNILAIGDGQFVASELQVIKDYVIENFPLGGNLDQVTEILSTLKEEDLEDSFRQFAEQFYAVSTENERLNLIKFAMRLINADDQVVLQEGEYITQLYNYWAIE